MKSPPVITTLTDTAYYLGCGEDTAPECSGAFAINPTASLEMLLSASTARANRVRSLLVPYAFGCAGALDSVSPDDLRELFTTLVDMQGEVVQLLEYVTAVVSNSSEACHD
ncbi:hypothetical protein CAL26_23815 [Bordetella genomosp. 9]|uniref:DUF3077 domain-containing protein n=1 Tax=Bordetella genomosp. 9 TaxID=1416803 RepID=A0A261R676_9BORD|nr:hypothetical protein [Bordetella genomosp. 9]OZI20525.1 hypothetical protein CAL26_23815 [Bordetella genomosp. 9]